MLSADGHQIPGWVTAPDVLRAIARQISTAQAQIAQAQTAQAQTAQAQAAAERGPRRPGRAPAAPADPAAWISVHTEITIPAGSPAAGRMLADVSCRRAPPR